MHVFNDVGIAIELEPADTSVRGAVATRVDDRIGVVLEHRGILQRQLCRSKDFGALILQANHITRRGISDGAVSVEIRAWSPDHEDIGACTTRKGVQSCVSRQRIVTAATDEGVSRGASRRGERIARRAALYGHSERARRAIGKTTRGRGSVHRGQSRIARVRQRELLAARNGHTCGRRGRQRHGRILAVIADRDRFDASSRNGAIGLFRIDRQRIAGARRVLQHHSGAVVRVVTKRQASARSHIGEGDCARRGAVVRKAREARRVVATRSVRGHRQGLEAADVRVGRGVGERARRDIERQRIGAAVSIDSQRRSRIDGQVVVARTAGEGSRGRIKRNGNGAGSARTIHARHRRGKRGRRERSGTGNRHGLETGQARSVERQLLRAIDRQGGGSRIDNLDRRIVTRGVNLERRIRVVRHVAEVFTTAIEGQVQARRHRVIDGDGARYRTVILVGGAGERQARQRVGADACRAVVGQRHARNGISSRAAKVGIRDRNRTLQDATTTIATRGLNADHRFGDAVRSRLRNGRSRARRRRDDLDVARSCSLRREDNRVAARTG